MTRAISDTVTLSNGVEMPRLGLGTYKSAQGGDVERAVATALEAGYRAIDTASLYGNETGIGEVIAGSEIPRDELFITTKVWDTDQGYESTRASLHHSLERLQLDHVDLFLVHWPIAHLMESTWRAMEDLLEEGHVRAIGVSNFLRSHIEQLGVFANVSPMVNQFEFHPGLQQPDLVSYCREHDIAVTAWAPLMRGRIAEMEPVVEIANLHGVTPAQVGLRWVLQRGVIAIPKSVHAERVRENADIFGFELDEAQMARIDALDCDLRLGQHPDARTQ